MGLSATAKMTKIYDAFFRAKLFNRIILIYSALTIVTFCTLAVLVYQYSTTSLRQKEFEAQTEAVDGGARYLDQQMDNSQEIVLRLYQNQALLNDMMYFLRNDMADYIQYRFNEYISRNSSEDRNIETFIRSYMSVNRDILQIALYSRSQSFLFVFNGNKTQNLISIQGNQRDTVNRDIDFMRLRKTASERTPELDRILGLRTPGAYTFAFSLNNPDTLQNEGTILVTYDPDGIRRVLAPDSDRLMGSRIVLLQDGFVVYDSSGRQAGSNYPFVDRLGNAPGYANLDVRSYAAAVRKAKSDILVGGIVPVRELENRYTGFRNKVVTLTGLGILITIIFSSIAVQRYARRTRGIVKAMRLVQQGNLTVRVPAGKNDELDEISGSFNRMCEELTRHINQVFVSEIKANRAELVAFQAQINPHFLYNTLEAIRMRALTLGAADVGEMTYMLGSMFRYAVKPETVVTLEDEAEYCRQYLELHKVRFKDKIEYRIDIDESVNSARVFKLFLQPLVENAIVHGLKPVKAGSRVELRAFLDEAGTSVVIEVEDNGRGIEPGKLEAVRAKLASESETETSSSLGLRNVKERIRLTYGETYGLDIRSAPGAGTLVRVRIPYEKGEK